MLLTFKHIRRKFKDTITYVRVFRNNEQRLYQDHLLGSAGVAVMEAQILHAAVYLQRAFISSHDIGIDGRMTLLSDPHQEHAVYFAVKNRHGALVATSRQIHVRTDRSHDAFPILSKAKIEKRWRDYIMSIDSHKIVEISGLAKFRGESKIVPLFLYRKMWHYSLSEGHTLWLMACDVVLYQRLKLLLGDAIVQIGRQTSYQGGEVIPALVHPVLALDDLTRSIHTSRFLKRKIRIMTRDFFLYGMPQQDRINFEKSTEKRISGETT